MTTEDNTQDYLDSLNTAAEKYDPPATIEEETAKNKSIINNDMENFSDDYEYTREKLKEMYEEGILAIDHFREVAQETGEPRAVEVLANLIKSTASIAESVMVNAKNKSSINKEMGIITKVNGIASDEGTTINQTNNTVFIGTTNDLQKILNEAEEAKEVVDAEIIEND